MKFNYHRNCNDQDGIDLPQLVRFDMKPSLSLHLAKSHKVQGIKFATPYTSMDGVTYVFPLVSASGPWAPE